MTADINQIDETKPLRMRSFYLRRELWRAAMWGIGGCIAIAGVILFIPAIAPQRLFGERIGSAAFFLAVGGFLSQFLLVRVRVDHRGISRRVCWWWDLWSWELFSSGKVRRGLGYCDFEDPDRPPWRAKLELKSLEDSDTTEIKQLINKVWAPPLPEPIPEAVRFEVAWPDKRLVEINSTSIVVRTNGAASLYCWNEVTQVEIWRLEASRPDFHELRLGFSDQEIALVRIPSGDPEYRRWKGASAEHIAAKVRQFVAPSRLQDWAVNGPPRSLKELDARELRDTARSTAALQKGRWGLKCSWGCLGLLALIPPWPKGIILATLYLPLLFAGHWMLRDYVLRIADRRAERELQRRQFARS
ncbi:MAG: hypothetical protein R3C59_02575 [Planctomycetaceae bacterium]